MARAIAAAKTIEDPGKRASALNRIASDQAKTWDFDGAQETIARALAAAKTIEDPGKRASTLTKIASAQAKTSL